MPGWWCCPGVSTASPVSQGSNPRDSSAHQSSSLPGLGVRGAHSVLTPAPGAQSLEEQSSMWHPDLLRKQMTQDCDKWKKYLGVNQLYIWLWVVENTRQAKDVGRKEEMNELGKVHSAHWISCFLWKHQGMFFLSSLSYVQGEFQLKILWQSSLVFVVVVFNVLCPLVSFPQNTLMKQLKYAESLKEISWGHSYTNHPDRPINILLHLLSHVSPVTPFISSSYFFRCVSK